MKSENLKAKLKEELVRLKKRELESTIISEIDSLKGSMLTVKKIISWLE